MAVSEMQVTPLTGQRIPFSLLTGAFQGVNGGGVPPGSSSAFNPFGSKRAFDPNNSGMAHLAAYGSFDGRSGSDVIGDREEDQRRDRDIESLRNIVGIRLFTQVSRFASDVVARLGIQANELRAELSLIDQRIGALDILIGSRQNDLSALESERPQVAQTLGALEEALVEKEQAFETRHGEFRGSVEDLSAYFSYLTDKYGENPETYRKDGLNEVVFFQENEDGTLSLVDIDGAVIEEGDPLLERVRQQYAEAGLEGNPTLEDVGLGGDLTRSALMAQGYYELSVGRDVKKLADMRRAVHQDAEIRYDSEVEVKEGRSAVEITGDRLKRIDAQIVDLKAQLESLDSERADLVEQRAEIQSRLDDVLKQQEQAVKFQQWVEDNQKGIENGDISAETVYDNVPNFMKEEYLSQVAPPGAKNDPVYADPATPKYGADDPDGNGIRTNVAIGSAFDRAVAGQVAPENAPATNDPDYDPRFNRVSPQAQAALTV